MQQFIIIYVKLQSGRDTKKMFFTFFIVQLIAISALNAETFNNELKLSKSQDLTSLRVEYYKSDENPNPTSLTYFLFKGQLYFLCAKTKK